MNLEAKLAMADRLHHVTQRVGFALFQLQELEGSAAIYFVLLAQAKRGMGEEAGKALVEDAQAKTFGTTLKRLNKANLIPSPLAKRFESMLAERNWLAHNSRASARGPIATGAGLDKLTAHLDAIADEAGALLKEVAALVEQYVKKLGVSEETIRRNVARVLERWHKEEG